MKYIERQDQWRSDPLTITYSTCSPYNEPIIANSKQYLPVIMVQVTHGKLLSTITDTQTVDTPLLEIPL